MLVHEEVLWSSISRYHHILDELNFHSWLIKHTMDDNGHQWISAQFPRSQVWDGETQKLVDSVRSVIHSKPPPTILQLQNYSLRSRPLGNEFCVTYQKLPVPPQDEAKRALFRAIQALGKIEHEDAPVAEVGLEWVSMRENYSSQSAEAAKVDPHSVETKITVLHIHGGGMLYGLNNACDPMF